VTYEEYIAKLNELKRRAERSIIQDLPNIEKAAYQIAVEYFDQHLDTKAGRIVPDDRALRALNRFTDEYLGAFTESQTYKGAVSKYLKNFKSIGELMEEFQRGQGLDVKRARIGAVQEIVIGEIVNQYSDNGLNKGFVQPLRELFFNNVSGGLNLRQAKAQLKDFIASGKDTTGKLGQYLTQTAQQGVDSYTGAINTRIMQSFDVNTLIMSGSLIKTSSRQCRYALTELGGIIDRSDWPKLEEMAKEDGLVEGTTFDTLPFNKLHWGCRHEFSPAVLTPAQRQKLLQNPVNE
jgi:hypothetical protein